MVIYVNERRTVVPNNIGLPSDSNPNGGFGFRLDIQYYARSHPQRNRNHNIITTFHTYSSFCFLKCILNPLHKGTWNGGVKTASYTSNYCLFDLDVLPYAQTPNGVGQGFP